MLVLLEKTIRNAFSAQIQVRYGSAHPVLIEQPKNPALGELALPLAFQLARELKRAPAKIAAELVAEIGEIEGVSSMEVAGNGYINVRINRLAMAKDLLSAAGAKTSEISGKIVVEHTNINPNKAAHIGHLRNAVLGDTFVRAMRSTGRQVEVQNYIDNTGVQVADVVAAFHFLERKSVAEVMALIEDRSIPFDYRCWDVYAKVSAYYKDNEEVLAWRTEALHAIEAGTGELAQLAQIVSTAIVEAHLKTMLRLGIEYDVLPRESDILHLNFWAYAFELLKQRQAIHFEREGKNAGCWVMPAAAFVADPSGQDSKVIVRSNGIVTYVGKDIAYQLWKFGLLGRDFFYKPFTRYDDGRVLWITTDQPEEGIPEAQFGHATRVYNVIDVRQSYLQDVVAAGLKALGFVAQAKESIHFDYEIVALSPRCCFQMEIPLSDEDRKKPYIEVSGRKGLGVKADDLIDKLTESALTEVIARHPAESPESQREAATTIAVGALRYFLLKYTRTSVIAFDFQEALSFEGETGPYVQYAAVRARNILKKFAERSEGIPDFQSALTEDLLTQHLQDTDLWHAIVTLERLDSILERSVAAAEPAYVAKYAFQLAQTFSNFYHDYKVLHEEDRGRRIFLLWVTHFFAQQIEKTLQILGIPVPSYM